MFTRTCISSHIYTKNCFIQDSQPACSKPSVRLLEVDQLFSQISTTLIFFLQAKEMDKVQTREFSYKNYYNCYLTTQLTIIYAYIVIDYISICLQCIHIFDSMQCLLHLGRKSHSCCSCGAQVAQTHAGLIKLTASSSHEMIHSPAGKKILFCSKSA